MNRTFRENVNSTQHTNISESKTQTIIKADYDNKNNQ